MVKPKEEFLQRKQTSTKSSQLSLSNPVLAIGLCLAVIVSLFIGAYSLSLNEIITSITPQSMQGVESKQQDMITYLIWNIRLPRIILSVIIGAGLAASGAAIQGLFRNPLADPALIGITSGAMVFAVTGIIFTNTFLSGLADLIGYGMIAFLSFIGSVLSTILVYTLSTKNGRTSVVTMLLAGIAISALGGALVGLMTYFSTEDELRDITFWTLGSLSGANWKLLLIIGPPIILSFVVLLKNYRALDILLLGEQEANYLGVNTQQLKWIVIGCTALSVGCCVAVSGVITFIALVVPHLIRLNQGTGHKNLLIGSALLGGLLLVVADSLARTVIAPAELPIGILTALLGAPFFIWLLMKTKIDI